MGFYSEVVFVCLSVCNGFMVKIYRFTHSLRIFVAQATHGAIAILCLRIEDKLENKFRDIEDG